MSSKYTASRKRSASLSSSAYPRASKRFAYAATKSGAVRRYAPKRSYIRGRGAYYAKGGLSGSAKLGPIKVDNFNASAGVGSNQQLIARGLGSYSIRGVQNNSLIRPLLPYVLNTKYREGGTIIRHREFLGNVTSSSVPGQFKAERLVINPGNSQTFPWLNTLANNYESYEMCGLMFQFRSSASDAIASSTNLALGNVMMATQYDVTDQPFLNNVEMLNYTWSACGKVSDTMNHYIECAPKQSVLSRLYVRSDKDSSSTEDARFSDLGCFTIATEGLQGSSVVVGQLWVTYEVILFKPKLSLYGDSQGSMWKCHIPKEDLIAANRPFGTLINTTKSPLNSLHVVIGSDTNVGILTFPATMSKKSYLVVIYCKGDNSDSRPYTVHSYSDVEFAKAFVNDTQEYAGAPRWDTNLTNPYTSSLLWVNTIGDNKEGFVRFQCISPPTNATLDIIVTEMPYAAPHLPF